MINKLLPYAAHLLVALKKTIPAVLLLGTLSLATAPSSKAQITIDFTYNGTNTTVVYAIAPNTFSAVAKYADDDPLGFTVHSAYLGNLYNQTPGAYDVYKDDIYTNSAWNYNTTPNTFNGANVSFDYSVGYYYVPADYDVTTGLSGSMTWNDTDLVTLGFSSNTEAANGMFVAGGVTTNWSTSTTSPVPEPGASAWLFGLLALGWTASRRRRTILARV